MLFLMFELGNNRYAIDVAEVAEVLPLVHVKEIPQAPAGVAGVFNYRGAPVPVIDLSMLALGRPALTRLSTRLVLVHYPDGHGRDRLLGLIAEQVTTTIRREPEDFVASGVNTARGAYLGPVITDNSGVIQWVNATRLLPASVRDVLFNDCDAPS